MSCSHSLDVRELYYGVLAYSSWKETTNTLTYCRLANHHAFAICSTCIQRYFRQCAFKDRYIGLTYEPTNSTVKRHPFRDQPKSLECERHVSERFSIITTQSLGSRHFEEGGGSDFGCLARNCILPGRSPEKDVAAVFRRNRTTAAEEPRDESFILTLHASATDTLK